MKPINLQPLAVDDLAEADAWYEARRSGLGDELLVEVARTAALIAEFPDAFTIVEEQARRALLKGFPYQIIYLIEQESIEIIGVIHTHRDPEVWRGRIR
jgi:plasmid stabilization system protein ParE